MDNCDSFFETTWLIMASPFKLDIALFSRAKYLEARMEIMRTFNGSIKP